MTNFIASFSLIKSSIADINPNDLRTFAPVLGQDTTSKFRLTGQIRAGWNLGWLNQHNEFSNPSGVSTWIQQSLL